MKNVFSRQQKLAARPLSECPEGTIPNRLRPYPLMRRPTRGPLRILDLSPDPEAPRGRRTVLERQSAASSNAFSDYSAFLPQ